MTPDHAALLAACEQLVRSWTVGEKPEWGAESNHGNYGDAETNGAKCAEWACADALRLVITQLKKG